MEKKSSLLMVAVGVVVIAHIAMASVFLFHEAFNFTSSNSAVYLLKGKTGGIEVTRDLLFEDADRLVFMLDANCIFNYFMKGLAIAKGEPVLELTWDGKKGIGDVKQFRTDGTMISISFSRFIEDAGQPRGLFLGGDLPYGDISRSADQDSSGFGYYDGTGWSHMWCVANEGVSFSGENRAPFLWKYTGSRVLKKTPKEAIVESYHETEIKGSKIKMKRLAIFRAGEDYFILKVKITNPNKNPITYSYAYGDEPWLGNFGASEGDIGWYGGGLIRHETVISPIEHSYAGFWDYGNDAIGEGRNYTGYANFIEWISPAPSYVFFSNTFDNCCSESMPLYAKYSRVLKLIWLGQMLEPGESKDYVLAIGMAKVDPVVGLPVKPEVRLD